MLCLKKVLTITLLFVFLFDLVGYRIAFFAMQKQADEQFMADADDHKYDEKNLIAVHIPINLPYQTDWKTFERVDGEMGFKGKVYRYVKRKVSKGELIILCLPDEKKTHLYNAREAFDKLAGELQNEYPAKKSSSNTVKDILVEGVIPSTFFAFLKLHEPRPGYRPYAVIHITQFPHLSPGQPPDVVCS